MNDEALQISTRMRGNEVPLQSRPAGQSASTAPFVFRLGLQPLAFIHVVVLAVDQFRVVQVLPTPEANDDWFHTTGLTVYEPIIGSNVADAK